MNYIKLLKEYEQMTPQMKANMDKCLKALGHRGNFKSYAKKDYNSARKGLNSVIQMGDYNLMIEGVDGDIPQGGNLEDMQIFPDYNPNDAEA